MTKSKSEINRQIGKHQVDEQKNSILDAAEKLFLRNGIEQTLMIDIAKEAGITKITLYRYFPNRDEIALQIHAHTMNKLAKAMGANELDFSIENAKRVIRLMIQNFDVWRDDYRLMGMFDNLYLDRPATSASSQWTKAELPQLLVYPLVRDDSKYNGALIKRFNLVMSTTIWFLEKLALRGELTWSDKNTPLNKHLELFEEMILGYLNRLMENDYDEKK
jgi:AcrR family transcriptional regulator